MRRAAALATGILLIGDIGAAQAQSLAAATRDAVLLKPTPRAAQSRRTGGEATAQAVSTRAGPALQQSAQTRRRSGSGAVDTLTITSVRTLRSPGFTASAPEGSVRDDGHDVSYVREWPGAAEVKRSGYTVAVTPQAGLGYGSLGGSALAGATVTLTPAEKDAKLVRRLNKMGIDEGEEAYGDESRWYVFAAAKGRAVGLNMTTDGDRAMSTDTVALVGDAQAGVGWRKGDVQASVGYTRRSLRSRDPYINMIAEHRDEMVGLSLSYVPTR